MYIFVCRYWSTVPNREVKRLAELSVDEFCEISNFRELVIETINENNLAIPLKSSLLCFFDIFKNQPEKRDNEMFSKLKFDARYIVVLNILSPEEEEALASSFVKFQRNSNINELLQNKCTEKNCKEWFLIYKLKPEERKKLIFKDLVYYKISPSISRPNVKVESKTKSSSVNTISNTLKRKSTMDFTNDQKRLRLKSAQRSYSSINSTKPVNLNSPVEAQTKSSCVTPDIDKLGRNRFSISSNCSSSTVDSVIELAKLPTGQQQTDPEDSVDVTKLSCLLCRTSNVESILREQYYMNNITGTEENWLASKDCVMHDFVCNLIMGLFFSLDQITFNNEQHKQNFLQELEKLNEDSVTGNS